MATPTDRQNFNWRPNDNSASTRLKYDLEAEHWTRSFKSAQNKVSRSNIGFFEGLSLPFAFFTFGFSIFNLLLLVIGDIFKLIYRIITGKVIENPDRDKSKTLEEIFAEYDERQKYNKNGILKVPEDEDEDLTEEEMLEWFKTAKEIKI